MSAQAHIGAEDVIRALAATAAVVRLYPPTSEIPAQAVARFVTVSEQVTSALGPLRFVVEPKGFKLGEETVGEGPAQLASFAETLYAHQVGQLIVAPGVDAGETNAFLRCAASDPAATREEGGLRAVMVAAGVTHIAVIELTLRASTEEGFAGLDLTTAPLDVIGNTAAKAAAAWATSAAEGTGRDEVAEAIGGLEAATREIASERVAQALLQLDENTRSAVMAAALRTDPSGRDMDGMLSVIANMKPATLARLLMMTAARTGTDAASLMPKLELPPEAAHAISLLLRPSPRSESESGVPQVVDTETMAADAEMDSEADEDAVRAAVASADSAASATRALSTTLSLASRNPDRETVAAVGDALAPAVGAGAFSLVAKATALLREQQTDPAIADAATTALRSLSDADALSRGLASLVGPDQANDAAAVLTAAGAAGAEALLAAWLRPEVGKAALIEAARRMPEQVLAPAGRRLRSADPAEARDLVALLTGLGDKRASGALAQALDSGAPETRMAAIDGLAAIDTDDAWSSIGATLTHPDEATARKALAAIRKAGRRKAVPAMLAVLQIGTSGSRNQALKREIIDDVRGMGATEALPVLKTIASKRFVFGRSNRELRDAARVAVSELKNRSAAV